MNGTISNVVGPTLVAMATKILQIWATFSQKSILIFCLSMESSHFGPSVLHVALYKTLFFDFCRRPDELWSTNKTRWAMAVGLLRSGDWPAARHIGRCAAPPANHHCAVGLLPFPREEFRLYLNRFCTRNCGAGRPHVGLCPAHLVFIRCCCIQSTSFAAS